MNEQPRSSQREGHEAYRNATDAEYLEWRPNGHLLHDPTPETETAA